MNGRGVNLSDNGWAERDPLWGKKKGEVSAGVFISMKIWGGTNVQVEDSDSRKQKGKKND